MFSSWGGCDARLYLFGMGRKDGMVKFLQIKDYRAGGNAAMRIGLFRHRRAVLFYLFTTLFFFLP